MKYLGIAMCLFACVAAAIVMGLATSKATEAVARQPEASGKVTSILILGLALTESCAIYGFVTALIMLFVG